MNSHQRWKFCKALMSDLRCSTDDEKLKALVDAAEDMTKAKRRMDRLEEQRDELLSALESMAGIARLTIGWSCTPANADGPLAVAEQIIARIKRNPA